MCQAARLRRRSTPRDDEMCHICDKDLSLKNHESAVSSRKISRYEFVYRAVYTRVRLLSSAKSSHGGRPWKRKCGIFHVLGPNPLAGCIRCPSAYSPRTSTIPTSGISQMWRAPSRSAATSTSAGKTDTQDGIRRLSEADLGCIYRPCRHHHHIQLIFELLSRFTLYVGQLYVTLAVAPHRPLGSSANLRGRLSDAAPRCASRATRRLPRDAEAHANPVKKTHILWYLKFLISLQSLFAYGFLCDVAPTLVRLVPVTSRTVRRHLNGCHLTIELAVSHEYFLLCRCFLSEEQLIFLRNETGPQLGLAGPCTYYEACRPDPRLHGHVICAAGATCRRPLPSNLEPT